MHPQNNWIHIYIYSYLCQWCKKYKNCYIKNLVLHKTINDECVKIMYVQTSHLKNWSLVVPLCIYAFAMTVAVWQMDTLMASLVFLRISMSEWLLRIRNWRWRSMVTSPLRMLVNFSTLCWWHFSSSFYNNKNEMQHDFSDLYDTSQSFILQKKFHQKYAWRRLPVIYLTSHTESLQTWRTESHWITTCWKPVSHKQAVCCSHQF